MSRLISARRLAASKFGRVSAVTLASTAVLVAVAAPASADDSGYWPHSKPCQPGARYAAGWASTPDGDYVFGRDCAADGWGILVEALVDSNHDGFYDTVIGKVWDHSSSGDGTWNKANCWSGTTR